MTAPKAQFVRETKFPVNKISDESRFCELCTEEIQELMENAIPTITKKATNFGMRLFNGTYLNFSDKIRKRCNSSVN